MKHTTATPLVGNCSDRAGNFFPIFLKPLSTPLSVKIHPRLVDAHRQYPIVLSLTLAALHFTSVI